MATSQVAQTIPYSYEAEMSVLSAMLMDADAVDEAMEKLSDRHFYHGDTKRVFRAMTEIYERGSEIDTTTLHEQLDDGQEVLSEIIDYVGSAANVSHHIEILVEKQQMRYLVRTGKKVIETASQAQPGEADSVISQAESWIYKIAEDAIEDGPFHTKDFMADVADDLRHRIDQDGDSMGIPSGFDELDDMIVGMEEGDYVVIAGRPSMGKTALALNIMENVSVKADDPSTTVMFSLEMEKKKLIYRMLSSSGGINSHNLRTGDLSGQEMDRVGKVMQRLADAPLFIDDSGSLTPMQMRAKLRRIATGQDIGAIFVDYLQLLDASKDASNRQYEITHISRELKGIAKEFEAPIVALSQLNRAVEDRSPPRPILSDLRESGSIEQDADIVMFLYRPEYYNEDDEDDPTGFTELLIRKQRNGPTGMVPLRFVEEYTRFEDLSVGLQ